LLKEKHYCKDCENFAYGLCVIHRAKISGQTFSDCPDFTTAVNSDISTQKERRKEVERELDYERIKMNSLKKASFALNNTRFLKSESNTLLKAEKKVAVTEGTFQSNRMLSTPVSINTTQVNNTHLIPMHYPKVVKNRLA